MKKLLILIFACVLASQGIIFSQQKVWSLEDCIRYAIENNITDQTTGCSDKYPEKRTRSGKISNCCLQLTVRLRIISLQDVLLTSQLIHLLIRLFSRNISISVARCRFSMVCRIIILSRKTNTWFLPVSRIFRTSAIIWL